MADQCETPEYGEGPCHCAYHDPANARDERIETYYEQGARELAELLVDAEDENARLEEELATSKRDADAGWADAEKRHEEAVGWADLWRKCLDWGSQHVTRADRYRLAWLSARRRAADEANFGMEALDLLRAQMAQADAEHLAYVAELRPLMHTRMEELRRARIFVKEVQDVRGWCMAGDTYRSHLTPIYESLHELEESERENRPFRDRWTRVGPEHMAAMCPRCHMIQDDLPQPTPCTCDDEDATVAYWKTELERVHQERFRESTSATPHLESAGSDEDGGTVWRLTESSVPDVDVTIREI